MPQTNTPARASLVQRIGKALGFTGSQGARLPAQRRSYAAAQVNRLTEGWTTTTEQPSQIMPSGVKA